MTNSPKPPADDVNREIKNLIRTLHETEQRITELTGEGVDAVLHPGGSSYLLHQAQGRLRDSEHAQRNLADRQSSILNALPAHIALLDRHGVIVSVNEAWKRFASDNCLQQTSFGVGQNYLDLCQNATGPEAGDAHKVADGIRAVLRGARREFALDYPCHSENQHQWFRMLVSPVDQDGSGGAVVAHIDITERKRLEESATRRSARLAALVEAQRQLSATEDIEEFAHRAVEAAQHLTDAEGADFEELVGEELVYRATSGVAAGYEGLRLSLQSSLSGTAMLENRTLRCDDAETDPRVSDTGRKLGLRSMITAVVRKNEKAFGVIKVVCREPNRFDDEQTKILELFAHGFGTILQRKELARELGIRAAQQAAIARLSQQALTRVDFSDLLDSAAASIADTFAVDYSAIMRVLPDRQSTQIAAGTGWLPGSERILFPVGANSLSGYTLMSSEPVIIDDMRTDERFRTLEFFQRHRVVSGISVVIRSKDVVWGSLAAFSTTHRRFSLQDIDFLQAIANLLAEADHRLQVESALARQADLLDKANDAIIVCSLDTRITFWNKGAERLFGWRRDEVIGCSKLDILHDFDLDFETANQELLKSGEWRGIVRNRRKDGSEVTVQKHWSLIRDHENQPESVFSIVTDVTKQLALEEQLRQSQRLEAVGELTGGIAHDFNNLLTIVRGNSELLIEQLEDNEDLRMLADMILTAARRGADLTYRLLAFARRQPLASKVVDINHLIDDVAPLIRRAVSADIEVKLLKAPDLWLSLVDPSQLESALLNLCINARDAMPKGGQISIETANRHYRENSSGDDDGMSDEFVMISVSDAGVGIPKENLDRVFDPFFTTKDVGKRTGLGLSMVYGFIKQSRGHITIDSEVGKGTTITMFVPRSNEVLPLRDDVEISISGLGGSEQILLVEDDDLVRSQAERQLVSLGYRVTTAPDGPTALGIISRRDDIDLLFTDIIMPGGINGRVLANESVNMRPGLKVLYTSGYTDDVLSQDGRMDDGAVLLSKPYSRAELAQKVRASLNAGAQLEHDSEKSKPVFRKDHA